MKKEGDETLNLSLPPKVSERGTALLGTVRTSVWELSKHVCVLVNVSVVYVV